MEIVPFTSGGPATQAPPIYTADLRPAADAAALAADPRPATAAMSALPSPPMALAATPSQTAEVSRSLIAASAGTAVHEVTRVLKPWGVTMLPQSREPQPPASQALAQQPSADERGAPGDGAAQDALIPHDRARDGASSGQASRDDRAAQDGEPGDSARHDRA